jgi:hypothetical protein
VGESEPTDLHPTGAGTLGESGRSLSLEGDNVVVLNTGLSTSSGWWVNPLEQSVYYWIVVPVVLCSILSRGRICLCYTNVKVQVSKFLSGFDHDHNSFEPAGGNKTSRPMEIATICSILIKIQTGKIINRRVQIFSSLYSVLNSVLKSPTYFSMIYILIRVEF